MSDVSGTEALPRNTNGNLRKVSANHSDAPAKCWTDFKTKVLKVSEGCLRDKPGTSKSFLIKETRNIIEESRGARLEEKTAYNTGS